ncbi:N-acetyltransferase [Leclercia adecarboxylata]|uniref:GNAT family N-acetyltransferase n=1 Tax=Leclercia adecarboxylata TaxID=83655 RepID=UPI00111A977F|nr:N-acetyltransferase [Leclercia adecarboxylata]QCZ25627.1 GNAT family N-acetyltransferase [Leclercia adecarboxylata]
MQIKFNTATSQNIALHLRGVEYAYLDHLLTRVDLDTYALKIHRFAYCFEAWEMTRLIGLVAAYLNTEAKRGYITNVTVLPSWQSCGIASQLLRECINQLEKADVKEIRLEVAINSTRAQKLYLKHGFEIYDERDGTFEMVRYCP